MLNESEWLVSRAVVAGKAHVDAGSPCQDWAAVLTSADGRWLAAAVCDGAGTAPRADVGARVVAEALVDRLIRLTPAIDARGGPGAWLRDELHLALIEIRKALQEREGSLEDYRCTVVAVLIGRAGGMFLHIGDGLALGSKVADPGDAASSTLNLWADLVLSLPENGEYVNETFFVTQDDWYKHLRTTALPDDLDIIALTSDGLMPLVMRAEARPNSRFMDPVVTRLLTTPERSQRDQLLEGWLASPQTYPITGDDKTLLVAVRRGLVEAGNRVRGQRSGVTPAPAPAPVPDAVRVRGAPQEDLRSPPAARAPRNAARRRLPGKPVVAVWLALGAIVALVVALGFPVLSDMYREWRAARPGSPDPKATMRPAVPEKRAAPATAPPVAREALPPSLGPVTPSPPTRGPGPTAPPSRPSPRASGRRSSGAPPGDHD